MSDKDRIYEIGETFEWKGVKLRVEEEKATDSHIGCYFLNDYGNCSDTSGHPPCGATNRGTNQVGVIFVAVPEPEVKEAPEPAKPKPALLASDFRKWWLTTGEKIKVPEDTSSQEDYRQLAKAGWTARSRRVPANEYTNADLRKQLAEKHNRIEALETIQRTCEKEAEARGRAEFATVVRRKRPDSTHGPTSKQRQALCDEILEWLGRPEPVATEAVDKETTWTNEKVAEARGVAKRTAEILAFVEKESRDAERCYTKRSRGKVFAFRQVFSKFAPEPEPTMNFADAMRHLQNGKQVRRLGWDGPCTMSISGVPCNIFAVDIDATDWVVVKEASDEVS